MKVMDKDAILAVVRRKGHFRVSHRWRDDRLRGHCNKLVREGLLFKMPYWMVNKRCNDDPRSATFYAEAQKGGGDG